MVRNGAKYKYNNLICQFCGKVFNSKTRNKKQKCCDKSCGQKLAVRLGNKPRLFKKGLSSWNKGLRGWRVDYKHSEETKKKIGKANKSRKYLRISPVNELIRKSKRYKLWRKLVFERDKYKCVICGINNNRLCADHIKPFCLFPKLRFDINNGRTLCESCHKKTDTHGRHKFYTNQKAIKL